MLQRHVMRSALAGVVTKLDVALRDADVLVPEELLNPLDANACLIEQRGRR